MLSTKLSHVTSLHALKGQKLLAQGNALGNYGRKPVACKGKSIQVPSNIQSFCPFRAPC